MVDAESSVAPAGWYPDPESPDRIRYWNGSSWTDQSRQANPRPGKVKAKTASREVTAATKSPTEAESQSPQPAATEGRQSEREMRRHEREAGRAQLKEEKRQRLDSLAKVKAVKDDEAAARQVVLNDVARAAAILREQEWQSYWHKTKFEGVRPSNKAMQTIQAHSLAKESPHLGSARLGSARETLESWQPSMIA